MSGGSWNYCYRTIKDAADKLRGEKDPLRRALSIKVAELADSIEAIEWVDSDDWSEGDEIESIKTFLGKEADGLTRKILIEDGKQIIKRLKELGCSEDAE